MVKCGSFVMMGSITYPRIPKKRRCVPPLYLQIGISFVPLCHSTQVFLIPCFCTRQTRVLDGVAWSFSGRTTQGFFEGPVADRRQRRIDFYNAINLCKSSFVCFEYVHRVHGYTSTKRIHISLLRQQESKSEIKRFI